MKRKSRKTDYSLRKSEGDVSLSPLELSRWLDIFSEGKPLGKKALKANSKKNKSEPKKKGNKESAGLYQSDESKRNKV